MIKVVSNLLASIAEKEENGTPLTSREAAISDLCCILWHSEILHSGEPVDTEAWQASQIEFSYIAPRAVSVIMEDYHLKLEEALRTQ